MSDAERLEAMEDKECAMAGLVRCGSGSSPADMLRGEEEVWVAVYFALFVSAVSACNASLDELGLLAHGYCTLTISSPLSRQFILI